MSNAKPTIWIAAESKYHGQPSTHFIDDTYAVKDTEAYNDFYGQGDFFFRKEIANKHLNIKNDEDAITYLEGMKEKIDSGNYDDLIGNAYYTSFERSQFDYAYSELESVLEAVDRGEDIANFDQDLLSGVIRDVHSAFLIDGVSIKDGNIAKTAELLGTSTNFVKYFYNSGDKSGKNLGDDIPDMLSYEGELQKSRRMFEKAGYNVVTSHIYGEDQVEDFLADAGNNPNDKVIFMGHLGGAHNFMFGIRHHRWEFISNRLNARGVNPKNEIILAGCDSGSCDINVGEYSDRVLEGSTDEEIQNYMFEVMQNSYEKAVNDYKTAFVERSRGGEFGDNYRVGGEGYFSMSTGASKFTGDEGELDYEEAVRINQIIRQAYGRYPEFNIDEPYEEGKPFKMKVGEREYPVENRGIESNWVVGADPIYKHSMPGSIQNAFPGVKITATNDNWITTMPSRAGSVTVEGSVEDEVHDMLFSWGEYEWGPADDLDQTRFSDISDIITTYEVGEFDKAEQEFFTALGITDMDELASWFTQEASNRGVSLNLPTEFSRGAVQTVIDTDKGLFED